MSFKNEQTLVLIKPDGIQRSLIGEIISRYEKTGLKLIGLKFVLPTKDLIEKHYLVDPEWKIKVGKKSIQAYKEKIKTPHSEAEKVGGLILKDKGIFHVASSGHGLARNECCGCG